MIPFISVEVPLYFMSKLYVISLANGTLNEKGSLQRTDKDPDEQLKSGFAVKLVTDDKTPDNTNFYIV